MVKRIVSNILESDWQRPLFLSFIGASGPVLAVFITWTVTTGKDITELKTKQSSQQDQIDYIIRDLENHENKGFHEGMRDWALGKEEYYNREELKEQRDDERFNNLVNRLERIEKKLE